MEDDEADENAVNDAPTAEFRELIEERISSDAFIDTVEERIGEDVDRATIESIVTATGDELEKEIEKRLKSPPDEYRYEYDDGGSDSGGRIEP